MTTNIIVHMEAADIAQAKYHCSHGWLHMAPTETWQVPAGQPTDNYYLGGNADDFRAAAKRLIEIANTIDFGEPHPLASGVRDRHSH